MEVSDGAMENDNTIKLKDMMDFDDNQMADNIQEMKCPACGAPIELNEGIEAVICEYCGTKIFVDDEFYKYHRILKAQVEAKHREAKDQFELEKEKEAFENRRDVINTYRQKPIEATAVLLCTAWLFANIIKGHVGLAHFTIEFAVILWAMGEQKRPRFFSNLGLHLKHNKGQASVFIISMMLMLASISDRLYMGLFLISLCGLVWSVKTGKKTDLFADNENDTTYVYVRNNAIHYTGKPYDEAIEELRACGFSDIVAIQKRDLVKGWFAKAGDVISISINGDKSFSEGQEYPSEAKVIVEYHGFK